MIVYFGAMVPVVILFSSILQVNTGSVGRSMESLSRCNTTIEQGRSTLFKVEENGNNVWNVHSDTKREAVNQFLDQRGNPWKKAIGPKGSIVLTNNEDGTYIEDFYVYLNR